MFSTVPIRRIDLSFQSMIQGDVPQAMLDWLMTTPYNAEDWSYRTAIDCVAREIIEAIKDGSVSRWDIDLQDKGHKNQKTTPVMNCKPLPRNWSDDRKRYVLYGIVGSFRKICHEEVTRAVEAFSQVKDLFELDTLCAQAVERGLLVRHMDRVSHDHSIVDSKKVWLAYQSSLSLIIRARSRAVPVAAYEKETSLEFEHPGFEYLEDKEDCRFIPFKRRQTLALA